MADEFVACAQGVEGTRNDAGGQGAAKNGASHRARRRGRCATLGRLAKLRRIISLAPLSRALPSGNVYRSLSLILPCAGKPFRVSPVDGSNPVSVSNHDYLTIFPRPLSRAKAKYFSLKGP